MSKTAIRHITIPQNPARMSRARSRTTTQATALAPSLAMPSSLPSDSTSSPGKLHSKSSTKSSSRPSSSSPSRTTAEPSAMPSLDINIRDFFPEGDVNVLKYVDEASIVREQVKAFQSYHDETLARALQISQETALTEAEARIKPKGKTREPTSKSDDRGKTSSSLPSRKDVHALRRTSTPVPASDNVTKEGRVRREEGTGQSSLRELLLSNSSPTMTVPPLPTERYGPDEVTARMLAEDWRVSSLQDALLAHSDVVHPPVPISASPSTSSSSSASSSLFSPASTTSTALSSPISSPISSLPTPSSSSASAAARKGDASPTHAIPMTIPPEAFYSRSSHTRQSSSSTRSSVTSLRNSPPQTSLTTSPAKDKPLPLYLSSTYTSASSAAAAAAAAQVAANSSSSKITTVPSSTSHSEQNCASPTRASFPPSFSSSRSVSSASSASSALASSRAQGRSKIILSAESKSSAQKSAQSPERENTHISPGSKSSHTPSTASAAAAATAIAQNISPKVERVPENPSPRSSLRLSQVPSQWSTQEPNRITTSASVVAAEREKARMSKSTSSASAAAAAAKHSAAAKPPGDSNQRDLSSSLNPPSPSSSASALQTTRIPEHHTYSKDVLTNPPRPRNAEELFSAPRVKGVGQSMVVPISSLSESDDEDDDGDDGDTREEKAVQPVDEKRADEGGSEKVDMKHVPFVDIYTANRRCSKCGENIPSTPNTLLILTAPILHVSCPKCSTLHCRGCSRPANCPKHCTGSKSCVINNCCPQVRAIAIFEALAIFDRDYILEAGLNSGNKDRDEFVKALISKPLTVQSRKVESILVKAMTVITEIFKTSDCQPFPPSSPLLISLCFEVVEFFEHSLMPEVIRAFLDNANAKDWITHSGTYAVILDLLRYLLEGGSTSICGVMDVQLRKIERTCGLGDWMLGKGEIEWATEGEAVKERKRQEDVDDKQKKGEMYRGQLRGGEEKHSAPVPFHANPALKVDETTLDVVFVTPLKDLIPALEKFRKLLWELSARITFPLTVEKLNMLCDRISQLALSQVIGV